MNAFGIAKGIVGLVAAIGTEQVVKNIVQVTTPAGLKTAEVIATKVGGWVIAGMVSKLAMDYTDSIFDEAAALVNGAKQAREAFKAAQEPAPVNETSFSAN